MTLDVATPHFYASSRSHPFQLIWGRPSGRRAGPHSINNTEWPSCQSTSPYPYMPYLAELSEAWWKYAQDTVSSGYKVHGFVQQNFDLTSVMTLHPVTFTNTKSIRFHQNWPCIRKYLTSVDHISGLKCISHIRPNYLISDSNSEGISYKAIGQSDD